MLASGKGQGKIVQAILEQDKNGINEKNYQGQTALDLAHKAGKQEISAILIIAGATNSIDIVDSKSSKTHVERLTQQNAAGLSR